jgi:cytochrome c oxidase subunit 3
MSETVTQPVTMGPAKPIISSQYVTKEQQNETAFIGMWLFLIQEIMFFGGLFVAYAVYRYKYPITWYESSAHLNYWMGGGNTVVLLLSSVTMATCVYATQTGKRQMQLWNLAGTLALGITFLVVKYFEYTEKFEHGLWPGWNWNPDPLGFTDPSHAQLFFILYFIMSGMHAFHMIIGIAIGAIFWVLCYKREYGPNKYLPVEMFGFYWHFVDIVWVFLFPMLYLVSAPGGVH